MESRKNAYLLPYVMWLTMMFLILIFSSIKIYENNLMVHNVLINQMDAQSLLEISKHYVQLEYKNSNMILKEHKYSYDEGNVYIELLNKNNQAFVYSAHVEIDNKIYRYKFVLNLNDI